jgi:ABC-type nitrate/sulfonate/bicarbonate transport system substrate-binding protein
MRSIPILIQYVLLLGGALLLSWTPACDRSTPEPPRPTSRRAAQPGSTSSGVNPDGQSDPKLAEGIPLRFAQLSIPYSIVTHVAEVRGYYSQAGLAYEPLPASGDADVITALRSKARNAAIAGGLAISPVAAMIAAGEDPVIIATTVTVDWPTTRLVTFQNTGITFQMADINTLPVIDAGTLRGKRIGVTRDPMCDIYLSRLLAKAALKEPDVTVVTGDPLNLQRHLIRGGVDAAILSEPYIMQVRRYYYPKYSHDASVPDRGVPVVYLGLTLPQFAFNIVTTRQNLAVNRPALVNMLKALTQAEAYIIGNRPEVQEELGQWLDFWPKDLDYLFVFESRPRVQLNGPLVRGLLREELSRLKQRDAKVVVPNDVAPFVDVSLLLEIDKFRVDR